MTIIAVDPGKNGAVVWRNDVGVGVMKMPETRGDTIQLFKNIVHLEGDTPNQCVCYHERVANFIPGGGAAHMMTFGRMAERCSCIVETLGIRLIEITPQAWQKELGLGTSKRSKGATPAANSIAKREWKSKLKAESQRRFPEIKVTLANADALLILEAAIKLEGTKQ